MNRASSTTTSAALPPEVLQQLHLAAAHEKRGDFHKAVGICEQLLQSFPKHAVLLHYIGTLYLQLNQLEKALDFLEKAIKINPQQALSYNYAGIAYCQSKNLAKGINYYKKALKINPELVEASYNLGIALCEEQKFAEAEKHLLKAKQGRFSTPALFYNLGHICDQELLKEEALQYYKQAIALNPNYLICAKALGVLLMKMERYEEALAVYKKVLELEPSKDSHKHLSYAYLGLKKHENALHHLELAYDESNEAIFMLIGDCYSALKMFEKQIEILKRGLELYPKNLVMLNTLMTSYRKNCYWDDRDFIKNKLLENIDTDEYLHREPQYYILGYTLPEEKSLALKIGSYYQNKFQEQRRECNFKFSRKIKSKIRIGYLSANIKNHANTHGTVSLFPNHDRENFEIFLYSAGKRDESSYAKAIVSSTDKFIDLYEQPLMEAAKQIHADEVDILVDLTGYHNVFSSSILSLHPAKLQIAFSGHCGTRGADFIDYMFTDKTVVKEDEIQYYHEKLIFLPHTHFIANDQQEIEPVTRSDLKLPEDTLIFTCFNLALKYDAISYASWMNILKKVPNSVLLLWAPGDNNYTRENLKRYAREQGVEEERILFAEGLVKKKHLGRLQTLDLFLDAFTCTAHVTCVDALLANLPLVTLYGNNISSRGASSILKAFNMPELIAYSVAEYEEKAVHYATHPHELKVLKEKIALHKTTEPLFKAKDFVSHLEKGYLKALELYSQNKAPENIFL